MALSIVLTAAQADQVRGITTKGHALAPAALKDGTFYLPIDVLTDPAHASMASILGALPTREIDLGRPGPFAGSIAIGGEVATDPVLIDKYAYKRNWTVGKVQALDGKVQALDTIEVSS